MISGFVNVRFMYVYRIRGQQQFVHVFVERTRLFPSSPPRLPGVCAIEVSDYLGLFAAPSFTHYSLTYNTRYEQKKKTFTVILFKYK